MEPVEHDAVPGTADAEERVKFNRSETNLTNVLLSRLTNEASLAWTRFSLYTDVTGLDAVSSSGLDYPYANLFKSSNPVLPNVSFEKSVGQLYVGGGELPPYLGAQDNYTFNDGVTFLKSTHLFRAGFYAQYARYNLLTTGSDNGAVDRQIRPTHRQRLGRSAHRQHIKLQPDQRQYSRRYGAEAL